VGTGAIARPPSEARQAFADSKSNHFGKVYRLITPPPPPPIYWNQRFSEKSAKDLRATITYGQNLPLKGLRELLGGQVRFAWSHLGMAGRSE